MTRNKQGQVEKAELVRLCQRWSNSGCVSMIEVRTEDTCDGVETIARLMIYDDEQKSIVLIPADEEVADLGAHKRARKAAMDYFTSWIGIRVFDSGVVEC